MRSDQWIEFNEDTELEPELYFIRVTDAQGTVHEYGEMYPNGQGFHRTTPSDTVPARVPMNTVTHIKFCMTLEQQLDDLTE